MAYFEHGEAIYEFISTVSGTDDWIVECRELANPAGFAGSIRVTPDGGRSSIRFDQSQLPVEVMRHWLSLLPDPNR